MWTGNSGVISHLEGWSTGGAFVFGDRRWGHESSLENFIPFEKFKRLNKRKYFVIPTASHKLHIFVTYKRLIWIQFDPFVHYNIINEVAHNSYNKIFPFGTPFAFLKRNKIFLCCEKVTCRNDVNVQGRSSGSTVSRNIYPHQYPKGYMYM